MKRDVKYWLAFVAVYCVAHSMMGENFVDHNLVFTPLSRYECAVTYLFTDPAKNESYVRGDLVIPETANYVNRLQNIDRDLTVKQIGQKAFYNCKHLTSIEFPSTLSVIQMWAFEGCSKLQTISIPSNVSFVASQAFSDCTGLKDAFVDATVHNEVFLNCTNLENVTFGKSTQYVLHDCFANCPNLKSITVKRDNPPITDGDLFRTASAIYGNSKIDLTRYEEVVLYIPIGTLDKYRADEFWGKFSKIIEKDFSNVVDIPYNSETGSTIYYNSQGIPSRTPYNGFNIIRDSEGRITKSILYK